MGKKRRGYKNDFQLPLGARLSGAQLALLLAKGDTEGHPFRGNQWTSGESGRGSDTFSQKSKATISSYAKSGYKQDKLTAYADLADEVNAGGKDMSQSLHDAAEKFLNSVDIAVTNPKEISAAGLRSLEKQAKAFLDLLVKETA